MEQIIIDFSVDSSQLKTTLDILVKTGQVTEADAKAFLDLGNASKKAVDNIKAPLTQLNQALKETGANVSKAFVLDTSTNVAKSINHFQSLRTAIKQATGEAIALAREFGSSSVQAEKARNKVAELRHEFEATSKGVAALDPLAKFTAIGQAARGIAGGFAAAQGALALFGTKSKEVEEAILKVQGALALSQGLNELFQLGEAFKNIKALIETNTIAVEAQKVAQIGLTEVTIAETAATEGAAVATKTFTTALLSNPIVIAIAAIAAIAGAYELLKDNSEASAEEIKEAAKQQKEFDKITSDSKDKIALEVTQLDSFFEALKQTNAGSKERSGLIEEINSKYGTTLKNLSNERDFATAIAAAYTQVKDALIAKLNLEANEDTLKLLIKQKRELQDQIDLQDQFIQARKESLSQLQDVNISGATSKNEEFITTLKEKQSKIQDKINESLKENITLQQTVAKVPGEKVQNKEAEEARKKAEEEQKKADADRLDRLKKLIADNTEAAKAANEIDVANLEAAKQKELGLEETSAQEKLLIDIKYLEEKKKLFENDSVIQAKINTEIETLNTRLKDQKIKDAKETADAVQKQNEDADIKEKARLKKVGEDNAALQKEQAKQLVEDLKQIASAIFTSSIQNAEDRKTAVLAADDAERQSLEDKFKAGHLSRKKYDAQLKVLEDKRAADQKKLDADIAEQKRKQAIANKIIALFNIAVHTAEAVMTTTAELGIFGLPAIPAIIALGVIEAGIVAAAPLPKFHKGRLAKTSPNEETAIIRKDETIFDPQQSREYAPTFKAIYHRQIKPSVLNDYVNLKLKNFNQNTTSTIDTNRLAHDIAWALRDHKEIKLLNTTELASEIAKYIPQSDPRKW